MRSKIFLTTLVLVGLVGLGSNALGQVNTNVSSIKLPEGAIDLRVPINLINNSTEIFWTSPSKIPATMVARVINDGKMNLLVRTASLNSTTNEQIWNSAELVVPGDGLILFGKYISLQIGCQGSKTKQYGSGTLDVLTWIPK